jgi:O-methyltransferase
MSLFQTLNLSVLLILVILLVRLAWNILYSSANKPADWLSARKSGQISPELRRLERIYTDKARFFNWWLQTERLRREAVPGAFAEVGVYKGHSARILHAMGTERTLHLFDTFEGFRRADLQEESGEAAGYTPHHFADTQVAMVLRRIGGGDRVVVHKGDFASTCSQAAGEIFALVNIDADLYNPTKAALEFFYPRLSPGGVILVHDHNHRWEGVRKAVEEFLRGIPETLAAIPDRDSTVMIIRNKR